MRFLFSLVLLALAAAISAQTCGFTSLPAGAVCGTNINNTLTFCSPELSCYAANTTQTQHCTLPSKLGESCSSSCVSNSYATFDCINGKCSYLKHVGQTCFGNAECFSNNCTVNAVNGTAPSSAGTCQALNEFSFCVNSRDCGFDLYCNKTSTADPTGICVGFGRVGEGCTTSSPCAAGLNCYVPAGEAFGICRARGAVNATCTIDADCATGNVCGPSGSCIVENSRALNETCSRGVHCATGLACNGNTCQTASSVSCSAATLNRCKSTNNNIIAGCDCGNCFERVNPCHNTKNAFDTCLNTKCPSKNSPVSKAGGYYVYDNSSCAHQCETEFNAYQCCLVAHATPELPYVKLADSTAVCTSPSPSASPSVSPSASPSTSPSSSPTPTPSASAVVKASATLLAAGLIIAMML